MLIVQSLRTIWGKGARGGDAAGRRNTTPEVLPIMLPQYIPNTHNEFLGHFIRYGEIRDFVPYEWTEFADLESSFSLGCIDLCLKAGEVEVVYNHTWHCGGMPLRYNAVPVGTLNKAGQWAQVIYNGRYSPTVTAGNVPYHDIPIPLVKGRHFVDPHALWWYEKRVYNIALTDKIQVDVFMSTPPTYRYRNIARLHRARGKK